MADHLTPTITNRGFKHLPPIDGAYGGQIRVYESSAAIAPHIWLRCIDDREDVTLHLPVEAATQLAAQILWLVEHHYQNFGEDDRG